MKNKIEDLRNHLFEEIEKLKESAKPADIERAKTVSNLSGRLIDSAKVEVDYLRAIADIDGGATAGTGFINTKKTLTPVPDTTGRVTSIGHQSNG